MERSPYVFSFLFFSCLTKYKAIWARCKAQRWLGHLFSGLQTSKKTKLNSVALVRKRTIPAERPPLVGKLVPTFADRGCRVISATDSHDR
jgi:hypothetical protein